VLNCFPNVALNYAFPFLRIVRVCGEVLKMFVLAFRKINYGRNHPRLKASMEKQWSFL
jgi:hypothetical protein